MIFHNSNSIFLLNHWGVQSVGFIKDNPEGYRKASTNHSEFHSNKQKEKSCGDTITTTETKAMVVGNAFKASAHRLHNQHKLGYFLLCNKGNENKGLENL